ncbi:MAG: trypsin-like peptidase domain-containing protein [Myxococcota bacterium]
MMLALSAAPLVAQAQPAPPELTEQRRINIATQLERSSVVVRVGRSGGSGFIATREGWVVTNAHVVQGHRRQRIEVRFSDGRTMPAQVIAVDRGHDLALLRPAENPNLPPLALGDPASIQVGQTVLAYGSPFGLDGTLTQGIVSARRDLPGSSGTIEGVIQTDAPINPGNSGGPLANSRGQVIGVNTAILSRTGGSHGIGFAMPSSYVRELIATARSRPERVQQRPQQAQANELPVGDVWVGILGDDFEGQGVAGVRIQRVIPGGPAASAGLRGLRDPMPNVVRRLGVPWTGHIIVAVDGRPVRNLDELKNVLEGRNPGERATLTLTVGPGSVRGEVELSLQAPPTQLPSTDLRP